MIFENWTADYLKNTYEIDDTSSTVTLSYWCLATYLWNGMPPINSYYPGDMVTFQDLLLKNISIRDKEGGDKFDIRLTYKSPQRGTGGRPEEIVEGATVYTMEDGGLEKPIETHAGYNVIWNHHLSNKDGTSQGAPSTSNVHTGIPIPGGANKNEWAWIKDLSEKSEKWEVQGGNQATKPGVESYLIGAPVVRERIYYTLQASANSAASGVGSPSVPGNTFGLGGDSTYWLKMSASVYYEDPFWVADAAYQYGKQVTEIYS